MSSTTTITTTSDQTLTVRPHRLGVRLTLTPADHPLSITAVLEPTALLAALDAAAPDAMRAYLRETVTPEPDDAEGGITAALIERELPEADSREDVDERRLCDPLTDEQLAELRESGRTLGEAWRTFTEAVREGRYGADR